MTYHSNGLNIKLSAQYDGHRADLDKRQERHRIEAGLSEVSYATDRFKAQMDLTGRHDGQSGHNPYQESSLRGTLKLSSMVLKRPRIWLGAYGGAAVGWFESEENEIRASWKAWWAGGWLSMYY